MTDRPETRDPRDTGRSPSVGPERGSRAARQAAERRKAIRNSIIAIASTLTVFLALAYAIVNAPNWPAVEARFFDVPRIVDSLPDLLEGFLTNVGLFLVAELLVLAVALVVAVIRSVPGPAFLPFRVMATIYTDVFRAVPGVVWIFVLGFGIPGLRIEGVPREPLLWGLVALVLIYSAYVSEVYRAGIESVHPSQDAAARSLGLSRPVASLRGLATGRPARDPAAPQ